MLNTIILCLGLSGFASAHETATLALPAVGTEGNPYRSVFGLFEETNGTRDLLTIPEGQDFIITAYRELGGDLEILRDDEVILGIRHRCTGTMLPEAMRDFGWKVGPPSRFDDWIHGATHPTTFRAILWLQVVPIALCRTAHRAGRHM